MSVRLQKRRDSKTGEVRSFWMVDVEMTRPNGEVVPRIRRVSPVQSRRGAEQFERELRQAILDGTYRGRKETREEEKPTPTVAEFEKEFQATYVAANNKPSERAAKKSILQLHVVPYLGSLPIDEVGRELEPYKARLLKLGLSKKRLNNVLAVVSKMLRYAEERELIARAPRVRLFKLPPSKFDFFDFEEWRRLVAAARQDGEWGVLLIVAGDAGLRLGELIGLEWDDVDFRAGSITIRRNDWHGIVGTPKSGRSRLVPMTDELTKALKAHRHLRGKRVFCTLEGKPLTRNMMKKPLWRACRVAGLRKVGWHVLRHTFCSHLAMQGAVPKAIQELAGHTSIATTMRYMHLTPAVLLDTVRLLDRRSDTSTAT